MYAEIETLENAEATLTTPSGRVLRFGTLRKGTFVLPESFEMENALVPQFYEGKYSISVDGIPVPTGSLTFVRPSISGPAKITGFSKLPSFSTSGVTAE